MTAERAKINSRVTRDVCMGSREKLDVYSNKPIITRSLKALVPRLRHPEHCLGLSADSVREAERT